MITKNDEIPHGGGLSKPLSKNVRRLLRRAAEMLHPGPRPDFEEHDDDRTDA